MHTSASSVIFTPHNFFDRDPSRESSQGVRLELREREKTQYFGGRYEDDLRIRLVSISLVSVLWVRSVECLGNRPGVDKDYCQHRSVTGT